MNKTLHQLAEELFDAQRGEIIAWKTCCAEMKRIGTCLTSDHGVFAAQAKTAVARRKYYDRIEENQLFGIEV